MVRPSTLLHFEPEFGANPVRHPARFPLELPTFFIKLLSKPGQLIVDPFGGTGTTALAAEKLERRWLVSEIDPKYADCIVRRYQEYMGKKAVLDGDGRSFEEVALERVGASA